MIVVIICLIMFCCCHYHYHYHEYFMMSGSITSEFCSGLRDSIGALMIRIAL